MFMHQAGNMPHEQICESLELFARRVMPEFHEHEAERQRRKADELAPYVEAAFKRKRAAARPRRVAEPCDAYGLTRPPVDASVLPQRTRDILNELERMKHIAVRLDAEQE